MDDGWSKDKTDLMSGGSDRLDLEEVLRYAKAIPVNAQEKEGAWAFLKLLITEPLYAARSRGGWLPV